MSAGEIDIFHQESRQHMAAEVVELGESLFETVLEARSHQGTENQEGEQYPEEEIRATAQEFFTALRLLLGIDV